MKKYLLPVAFLILLFNSCDTDDNNNPSLACDANFYSMGVTNFDPLLTGFDFYKYPKSTTLSTPVSVNTGNSFNNVGNPLYQVKTTSDPINQHITYYFPFTDEWAVFDTQNNALVSQSSLVGVSTPEYLNGNLLFLQESNSIMSSYNTLSADFKVVNTNLTAISSVYNLDFTGTGYFDANYLLSTSDNQEKIFYLANTKLIIYNNNTGVWSDFLLETYDNNTNRVFYIGVEYVDANTLFALRGNVTTGKLEIVKIDLSAGQPSVSIEKNLTGLSIPVSSIINAHDGISTEYDACDNSFYFVYNDMGGQINTVVFEIKLNSNTVYEYPQNTKLLLGMDKMN